ncbi:MAG: hypothetical protein EHM37_17110 [Deltaproteobacteria bacterium]|jgi:hypothetical protein|nr:MAG: hypothetical protein EHM37_17110 [Deltaproteobacteria bacterium]
MAREPAVLKIFVILAALAAGAISLLPPPASAQEEVTSAIRRYTERETSTGYYEEYEVRPRRQRPFVEIPGVQVGLFPYSPSAAEVRVRTRLADSHMGIAFYTDKTCVACHPQEAKDIHTVRANLTCRQCHGGEPIASIQYFNSPMNPIRKHAYVCAKCHEGSSASFASYIIHEPAPGSVAALKSFPILYFVYWFMTVLLMGTLAFFIPHSFLTGLRELFTRKKEAKNDADTTH